MRAQLTVCFLLLLLGTALAKKQNGKKKKTENNKLVENCAEKNCSKICTTRQHLRTPFCGSDDVTYKTRCDFCMARCRAMGQGKIITVKSRRPCNDKPPKKKVKKPLKKGWKSTKPKNKKKQSLFRRCPSPKFCAPDKTICASNNVTYTSMCLFKVAKCQARRSGDNLSIKYRGPCGSKKDCPKLQDCKVLARTLPVCANNKVTYQSHCHFRVAACEARKGEDRLRMLYRGECGKPSNTKHVRCDDLKCGSTAKPLCASDKKTYNNPCEFQLAKCALGKKRSELKLLYHGPCGAKKQSKRCKSPITCTQKNQPVCGTDGKQYPSPCHLHQANCQATKDTTIKVKNKGSCV